MRAVLFILILAVLAGIAAVATGLIDINQTRPARAPELDASRGGITASGGQTPAFDVETGSISISAQPQNVTVPVPTVGIQRAPDGQPVQPGQPTQTAPAPPASEPPPPPAQ